jgi:hypothetical protein
MCKRYGIGHSRIDKKTAEDIWKYIQQQTVNHMLDNGLDVRREVEEPLAVAFEISWVKDRIVTQKRDSLEWGKIMDYELQSFKEPKTYPADPYYGGLYLVTTKSDRSTEADMQTINANISEVLKLSAVDMQKAYEHIQELM